MGDAARRSRSADRCSDRTRSTARRCAMVATHAIGLPLLASNRDAARQTSTKTSWVTSSVSPGSRTTLRTVPNTGAATRSYIASNAARSPTATRASKAARSARSVPGAAPAHGLRGGDTRPGPVSTPLIRHRTASVLAGPAMRRRTGAEFQVGRRRSVNPGRGEAMRAVAVGGSAGKVYEIGKADVICGNIQTANATVYVINKVLVPMH